MWKFLKDQATEARFESTSPLMSEAGKIHLHTKGKGRPVTFGTAVERAINNLVGLIGDKPIDTYSRTNANMLCDLFFGKGLSRSSVDRMFSTIKATINFTAREMGLREVSSFSGIYFGEEGRSPETKRLPIPLQAIRSIQHTCKQMNDEGRCLTTILSETGMRLSEAALKIFPMPVQISHDSPENVIVNILNLTACNSHWKNIELPICYYQY